MLPYGTLTLVGRHVPLEDRRLVLVPGSLVILLYRVFHEILFLLLTFLRF